MPPHLGMYLVCCLRSCRRGGEFQSEVETVRRTIRHETRARVVIVHASVWTLPLDPLCGEILVTRLHGNALVRSPHGRTVRKKSGVNIGKTPLWLGGTGLDWVAARTARERGGNYFLFHPLPLISSRSSNLFVPAVWKKWLDRDAPALKSSWN